MSIIPSLFGGRRSSVFDPFSLDVWDPFKDFPISSPSNISRETSALVNARVDWKETPEAHVFKADLPGIKKEEVKVEVEDGNILQITGERNVEKEDKNDTWHRVERSSGKFTRRFRLPENAKMDQVKAAMENGVLTITVPKEEVKKPDVKSIEISECRLVRLRLLIEDCLCPRLCLWTPSVGHTSFRNQEENGFDFSRSQSCNVALVFHLNWHKKIQVIFVQITFRRISNRTHHQNHGHVKKR